MIQTTLQIDGMMCAMCEAHMNDAIRNAFSVQKVSSSHAKHETVIISKEPLDEEQLRAVVAKTGYTLNGIQQAPYEKPSLFRRNK